MHAIVKYAPGPGNVELRDVPIPQPGAGQVQIEVKATGVCGSDLHIWHDQIAIPIVPPVVMGHEFSGIVSAVGSSVKHIQVGDRVTAETTASFCGQCLQCRLGRYNMCASRSVLGYAKDGCFADYCVVNERQVHILPDNVDFVTAALTEPLACCVHGVLELTHISPGDLVVITGPGAIGLLCLQLAKAAGAKVIVCGTDRDAQRLHVASQIGADQAVNIQEIDLHMLLNEMTNAQGADVFLECAGAPAAAHLGLDTVRRGGQYTQIGLFDGPFELSFDAIAYKELRVTGSLGQRPSSWARSLSLLAQSKVNTRALVTDILPLADWETAFGLFEEQKGLKLILKP